MKKLQIILDTNILYSGLKSRNGASFLLLSLLPDKRFDLNISVPLVIEYEDVLKRIPSQLIFNTEEIDAFLNNICKMANHHQVFYLWRPFLKDSGDDLILELAVKSASQYIVTYNKQDFAGVESFGIKVVNAFEFLKIIGEIS